MAETLSCSKLKHKDKYRLYSLVFKKGNIVEICSERFAINQAKNVIYIPFIASLAGLVGLTFFCGNDAEIPIKYTVNLMSTNCSAGKIDL